MNLLHHFTPEQIEDAAPHCPCCGHILPATAKRGGLMVTSEPWAVYWRGTMLKARPMEKKFLFLLVRQERVSREAFMLMVPGEIATRQNVAMQISNLRNLLAAARVPASIRNIHDWGYELDMEDA
jgi:DNA-binding winged helix-turn-helix (wHTH) protein